MMLSLLSSPAHAFVRGSVPSLARDVDVILFSAGVLVWFPGQMKPPALAASYDQD